MQDHPIKAYRERSGLTQQDLAALFGVSKATVSRWEARLRYPRRTQLSHIAEKIGVPISELIEAAHAERVA